jgi:hypothetical protein
MPFESKENLDVVYRKAIAYFRNNGIDVDRAYLSRLFYDVANQLFRDSDPRTSLENMNHYLLLNVIKLATPRERGPERVGGRGVGNGDVKTLWESQMRMREEEQKGPDHVEEVFGDVNEETTSFDKALKAAEESRNKIINNIPMMNADSPPRKNVQNFILKKIGENECHFKNVYSVALVTVIIPLTEFTVSNDNNQFTFRESSLEDSWIVATIPEGNYTCVNNLLNTFIGVLNKLGRSVYSYIIETRTGRVTLKSTLKAASGPEVDAQDVRLPGTGSTQGPVDQFRLDFSQQKHIGRMLGFIPEGEHCAMAVPMGDSTTLVVESQHRASIHQCTSVIVRIPELPSFQTLIPIDDPSRSHVIFHPTDCVVEIGQYEGLTEDKWFLPPLNRLTLVIENTTQERPYRFNGAQPIVEVRVTNIV